MEVNEGHQKLGKMLLFFSKNFSLSIINLYYNLNNFFFDFLDCPT